MASSGLYNLHKNFIKPNEIPGLLKELTVMINNFYHEFYIRNRVAYISD